MDKLHLHGKKFGRLTVIKISHTVGYTVYWICQCSCGNQKTIPHRSLLGNLTKSCGCLHKERASINCRNLFKKHGQAVGNRTYLYKLWRRIKRRCHSKSEPNYKRYGARGIKVFPKWKNDFVSFADYINKHLGNRLSEFYTIDRINNNSGYKPGNLRWATKIEQSRNTRNNHQLTFMGVTLILVEWAERTGIPPKVLSCRINKHKFSLDVALTMPIRKFKERPEITPDLSWIPNYKQTKAVQTIGLPKIRSRLQKF